MRSVLASVALGLCVSTVAFSTLQERTRPRAPREVPVILDAAKNAYQNGRFGTCMSELQEAMTLVTRKRRAQILGALPPAPAGWELEPEDDQEALRRAFGSAAAAGRW